MDDKLVITRDDAVSQYFTLFKDNWPIEGEVCPIGVVMRVYPEDMKCVRHVHVVKNRPYDPFERQEVVFADFILIHYIAPQWAKDKLYQLFTADRIREEPAAKSEGTYKMVDQAEPFLRGCEQAKQDAKEYLGKLVERQNGQLYRKPKALFTERLDITLPDIAPYFPKQETVACEGLEISGDGTVTVDLSDSVVAETSISVGDGLETEGSEIGLAPHMRDLPVRYKMQGLTQEIAQAAADVLWLAEQLDPGAVQDALHDAPRKEGVLSLDREYILAATAIRDDCLIRPGVVFPESQYRTQPYRGRRTGKEYSL